MLQWSDLLLEQGELAHGPLPHVQDPHQGGRHHHQAASQRNQCDHFAKFLYESDLPFSSRYNSERIVYFCHTVWCTLHTLHECCGSMKFLVRIRIQICGSIPLTNGSGSGCWSGPCYFRQWPSRCQKKILFFILLLFTFWRYIYIIFQRWKVIKKSQKSRNQCFSHYFCLMIEGSGSRRPKNTWILWIRIRIRNIALHMSNISIICSLFQAIIMLQSYCNPHKRHPPYEKRYGTIATNSNKTGIQ